MSVYIPRDKAGNPKTRIYQYDFKIKVKASNVSQRFFGSTGQTTARAAERVEARLKELAKLGQLSHSMTVAEACDKYWDQRMKRVRSAGDQATNLEVISTFLGPETLLVDITPAMVADAAARRAKTPLRRFSRKTGKVELTKIMPKPSSVNRQLIQPLRRLLKYARRTLGVPIDLTEFEWGELRYPEAEERNREISAAEEVAYWQAMRGDFHPIVELYLISGRRKSDWVTLTKDKVHLADAKVRVPSRKKKQQGELTVMLTPQEVNIIASEMAKSPAACRFVFTYEVQRGEATGERRAITSTGLRRAHATACKAAGITDFRIHDYRHTMATRLLRATGNPKLVMRALDHAGITSTARYMHVLEKDVLDARSQIQTYRSSPGLIVMPARRKAKGP
jgi:integrase